MRRFILSFVFLAFLGGATGLLGQEEIIFEPSDSIKLNDYFGNKDYLLADKYIKAGYVVEARPMLIKVIDNYKNKGEWQYYKSAVGRYILTFQGVKKYMEGISFGLSALELLETKNLEIEISDLYHKIGILYDMGGETRTAREYFDKELFLLQEHYVLDTICRIGLAYNSIAVTKANLGDFSAALSDFLRAEQIYLQSRNCEKFINKNLSDVYANIGLVYTYKGYYEKSIEYLNKGIAHRYKYVGKNDSKLVEDYIRLGNFYKVVEEFDLSKEYLNKGLSIIENIKTTNERLSGYLPTYLSELGNIALKQNEPLKAIDYFERIGVISKKGSKSNNDLIILKRNRAMCWLQMEEYDKALNNLFFADSLTALAQLSENEFNKFDAENKQLTARVYLKKNQPKEARKYLKALLELPGRVQPHTLLSEQINKGIALSFEKEQNLDSALVYIHKSLIDLTTEFNNYDYSSFPDIDDLSHVSSSEIFDVLEHKARYCRLKKEVEKDIDTKIFYSNLAFKVIDFSDKLHTERLKKQGALRGHQLKRLLEISLPFYREGLNILADYPDVMQEKERIENAFYFTQKMKARQLWATQLGSEAKQLGKIDKGILEKEQQLLIDIQFYEQQVKRAIQNKDSINLDLYQNNYLFNAKNDYRNLLAEIEENYPEFFETKFAFNPATLTDIQENLNKDEIVLEYTFSDENYVYLFVIEKKKEPQFFKIPLAAQTDNNISTLSRMLRKSSMERNTSREKFIKLSYALYNQFIEPAKEQITGKKRLIIIGEGKTNYIPFEALVQSDELKSFSDLDYLLTDYEVSYHYSSTLFTKSRKQARNNQSGIFAFAPVYENGLAPVSSNPMRSSMASDSTFRAFDTEGNFTPLPESEREVNAIADLFKKKGVEKLNVALREEANEENLKSNLQQSYQYIHIAGHSFANIKSPKFSGIACFQEEENTKEDGILYAGEIYNLSTKADLFTLSSCESGFGKLEETEGLLGLNRAFIYAGAPNVTFSLWKIYDKVSAECMIDFYGEILKDKSYASALRQAKLNLLKKEETASPHYWSPFLLIGR